MVICKGLSKWQHWGKWQGRGQGLKDAYRRGRKVEAVAENFRSREQYLQRQEGRKEYVVFGEQLIIYFDYIEHRRQKLK